MELPELPESGIDGYMGEEAFTADQMRAYGEQCVLAERERAAAVCEGVAATWATFHRVAPSAALQCAEAIRRDSRAEEVNRLELVIAQCDELLGGKTR